MKLRRRPPLAPNHPKRKQAPFAELSFAKAGLASPGRSFEVELVELYVGGACFEWKGNPPSTRAEGDKVEVFVDLGFDANGHRVAGTLDAELTMAPAFARSGRAHLIWSGRDPDAAQLVERLLRQAQDLAVEFADDQGLAKAA